MSELGPKKKRLSVVAHEEQLSGAGPADFERLARTAPANSVEHRGLVMIASTLAARTVATCVPPSVQANLRAHLEHAFLWVSGLASPSDVAKSRALCFGSVAVAERATREAVAKARAHVGSPRDAQAPLDAHADHVVDRYAGLAAHFTVSAVCHALDAVARPEVAVEVLQDVQGARAYQAAGLGAARHAAFRSAAWDQARWEAERTPGASSDRVMALGIQIFHEYLGGRWRAHSEAERAKNDAFVAWALQGAPR